MTSAGQKITPVILSGGAGTRLWPLSRTARPKQLLNLVADRSMLQLTALRTDNAERFAAPIIVGNADHADQIEQQLAAIDMAADALILEPVGRSTAPAIALAALAVPEDAILLVMPSDHVIGNVPSFHAAIERALPFIGQGHLATFGITPDAPETGFGYVGAGDELASGVYKVDCFVEKPDRTTAETYLAAGNYSWNGGIFLFRADAYLAALAEHAPAILDAARRAMADASRDGARIFPHAPSFIASPSNSIDYAVMEKASRVIVLPVDMGWSDVGSWDALHTLSAADDAGNCHHGEVIAIDTRNCLIRTEGPLVAVVGVSDLTVVVTKDAVLILPRGASQDVRQVVDELKRRDHATLEG